MNPELLRFHEQVILCKTPEELFGSLGATAKTSVTTRLTALKVLYRRFAIVAHVDKYKRLDEQRIAHIAFSRLNELHQQAIDKIHAGVYGTSAVAPKKNSTPPSMRSKKGIYVISSGFTGGDLSSLYLGEFDGKTPVIVKIAHHPSFNDLLSVEAHVLAKLNEAAKTTVAYKQFIPTLLDAFSIRVDDHSTRHVNVFTKVEDLRSLTDVMLQFPEGIDPRHFVWIFTRLLSTISFAHSQGVIHGAILPMHVLINPHTHGIHLVDWCFSAPDGRRVIAMSKGYSSYYPPEVLEKRSVSSSTDIYMAAMSMAYILGADFGLDFKSNLHPKFKRLLETCLFRNPARRPNDAWALVDEVQTIAKEAYGPKKFVKLEMA